MSTLTVETVLEEQRVTTGRRDKDAAFLRGINNAIIELIYKVRMREYHMTTPFSTVADQEEYAIGATEFAVISVRDLTNNLPLSPREVLQRDSVAKDLSVGAGAPTLWAEWEGNLLLFEEIPDAVYSMSRKALKRPTALTSESETMPTPAEWDEVLTLLAVSRAFLSVGEFEEGAKYRQSVDALLIERKTPEEIRKEHTSGQFFAFSDFSQK